uniref:MORN repeat protein n=1 Tax=viral metagenome TaxID=1070528 RepID=A0A6C0EFY2_9ZZZZ
MTNNKQQTTNNNIINMNTIINIIYIIVIFNIIITIIKSSDTCNFKKSGKDFTIDFKGDVKNNFKFSLNGIYNYIYYYGDIYCVGEWKMVSKNDDNNYSMVYYGDIKNGMPHGVNEHTMITHNYKIDNNIETKYSYTGSWNNGNKEGHGLQKITFIDKNSNINPIIITIQKGLFNKNDIIEGVEFSYLIDVNVCYVYVGKFYNNRPNGTGIIHYNNGTIFEGEFMKGNLVNIVKTTTNEIDQFNCLEKLIQPL